MNAEQLKAVIKEIVDESISKAAQDPQRKYAGVFGGGEPPAPAPQPEAKGEQLEPGIRMARFAKLMVLSKNDPEKALFIATGPENNPNAAKGMYPNDSELHNTLKSLTATSPTDGGFLIQEQYSNEIIPLLRAKAVVRKLGARALPLNNGNLNLPKVTGGATSYYQGELVNAKSSKPALGNVRLNGKKLITLVPISNDLIRSASYAADSMVRDDMIQSMALKEDYTGLYGKGTEFSPKGVYNFTGITKNVLNAAPTSDILATMVGTLMTKNLPWASVGWAFNGALWSVFYNLKDVNGNYIHRAEMNQGKLMGLRFEISNQIDLASTTNNPTDLFLGDWSEFMIGEQMGLEMMASNEATYQDENGNLVSAFSTDQTVLKVTAIHDFGMRHAEAFYVKTGVHTS